MIPVTETLLLDQPHSVITGDDLVPIVLNIAGALKCLKLGKSDGRSLMSDSCLSKLLELCILMSFPDAFSTSDLQFGHKKGFSTDLCTGLLKLVSSQFIHHGSKVQCALY